MNRVVAIANRIASLEADVVIKRSHAESTATAASEASAVAERATAELDTAENALAGARNEMCEAVGGVLIVDFRAIAIPPVAPKQARPTKPEAAAKKPSKQASRK